MRTSNRKRVPRPCVDWGEALAIDLFYGRTEELILLTQWLLEERSRVVSILGMGGIGKSALAVSFVHQLASLSPPIVGTAACPCASLCLSPRSSSCLFDVIIMRSLRDAPLCEVLLDDCLRVLSPQLLTIVPATLEQRIDLVLGHLRTMRVLMVLDNLESVLEAEDVRGHFRPGFEGYERLLQRVVETEHQSCLLLTSREKPAVLRLLESQYPQVRSLHLAGLDSAACQQLFIEKEMVGTGTDVERLIEIYGGNPLALKIVTETILDLFGGVIGEFLAGGTVIFGGITDLLDRQFARLSALERCVLYWLAIVREPVTLDELQALMVFPTLRRRLSEAVEALRRRSLIEPGKRVGSFTLQSVVLEYMTALLVAEASHEIQQGQLDLLIQHGLELAHCKEYVRQTQERLLISPLLEELQSVYWRQVQPLQFTSVEKQLLDLLDQLRKEADSAHGYGPANLIALLRVLRRHLRALDLSYLSIRGAYLQGCEMQDTNLSGALIRDSALTEALDAIWGVAISRQGTWWAAGSRRGEVRVWDGRNQTLHLAWQAHTDIVPTLIFSPDEHILVTGSWDGTIKLWNIRTLSCRAEDRRKVRVQVKEQRENRVMARDGPYGLLWVGEHTNVVCMALSPDGSMLASGGRDITVKLWDTQNGAILQTLPHPGYVYAIAWSPDGQLLATGDFAGSTRLWQIQKARSATCIQTFSGHTNWVMGLAFAPDGKTLASGSWDRTIKLWDIASGRMLQTLSGHTDNVHRLAWGPDGRTLASCSVDKTIRFWEVDQGFLGRATGHCRAVLHGHTSAIYDLSFTPDSSHLLSGSEDGTLRVWDVESCQCIRVIQGHAVSFYDIDWSPDSTQLISGGTEGDVVIWDAIGDTPPRVLHGHGWIVWGVGWSRDGKFLASSEHAVIHLWDPTSGVCLQKLRDPVALSMGVAWSPDGRLLACGTLRHGVQVWDVTTGHLYWSACVHPATIRYVSWSPDSKWLTAGGDEGTVYLWDTTDGTLLRRLRGHHGVVMRVAWRRDGTLMASCGGTSGSGEVLVWDTHKGIGRTVAGQGLPLSSPCPIRHEGSPPQSWPVQAFVGYPGVVNALAWSADGDRLIAGGSDGMLRWWDVRSGACVLIQKAHHGSVQSLRASSDGRCLASCGDDGAIMIWDLHSGEHLRRLRRDRPYERLNITGIRGLTEAQKASLRALGAIDGVAL